MRKRSKQACYFDVVLIMDPELVPVDCGLFVCIVANHGPLLQWQGQHNDVRPDFDCVAKDDLESRSFDPDVAFNIVLVLYNVCNVAMADTTVRSAPRQVTIHGHGHTGMRVYY